MWIEFVEKCIKLIKEKEAAPLRSEERREIAKRQKELSGDYPFLFNRLIARGGFDVYDKVLKA